MMQCWDKYVFDPMHVTVAGGKKIPISGLYAASRKCYVNWSEKELSLL